ncbi:MAG TPA: DUF6529 family protein [Actinomycetota bacterium]|nr:DUF6529 family protein [Actinomycetota bacterium]
MDDWVDELSRGNVAQVKTVLATVVMALAVYQLVLMAVGYGKIRPSFLKPKAASFSHRAVGDALAAIAILVAFMCISYFEVGDGIEHAADGETARATIHVIAGFATLGVLAVKVIAVRWWKRADRFLPTIGLTLFTLLGITWVTSAGDYLWGPA